jgi:hypothetical protein
MKTFYINKLANNHVNEYTNSDNDHYSDLISYTTRVASYNHKTNEMSVYGYFSQTTAKHINAFLEYYGFDTCNKKQLENYNKVLS